MPPKDPAVAQAKSVHSAQLTDPLLTLSVFGAGLQLAERWSMHRELNVSKVQLDLADPGRLLVRPRVPSP